MLQATETTSRPVEKPRADASPAARTLDLDALSVRSFEELESMYLAAPEPTSLRGADGKPRGRMLAVKRLSGPIAGGIRSFAASPSFVWDGKTFASTSDQRGSGHNRVNLPGVLGKQSLFPFETRIDVSALDGKKTIVLDYDLAANPAYIRRIHDEIREIEPGLYLGPAMLKLASGPVTVLWFALDTRAPSTWT
ncbi:MAG: hypothetical protein R3B70_05460 [Polyangiaceae bacterium]